MIRRRLLIEWDDDGVDTDEECAQAFHKGEWEYADLASMAEEVRLKMWVEDSERK